MNVHFTGRTNGEPKSKKFKKKEVWTGTHHGFSVLFRNTLRSPRYNRQKAAMDSTEKYCVFLVFTFHLIAMYQFHLPKCR